MTRTFTVRRALLALTAFGTALLLGCGSGGGDDGTATVRTLNLTTGVGAIDVSLAGTKKFTNITSGGLSTSIGVDAASTTVSIESAGTPTSLFSGTFSFSKDQHYTGVVWGGSSNLRFSNLPEDEDDNLTTGNTAVRVLNATSSVGAVDVYLTPATQVVNDLSLATPTRANVASNGGISGYASVVTGTYRLRITSAGNPSDVRLDVPSLTLGDVQYATVIVTAGTGNSLVNATVLVQQNNTLTAFNNGQARVRVVASVEQNADNTRSTVGAAFDGTALPSGTQVSPNAGPYTTVASGAHAVAVSLNGTVFSTTTQTLTAGGDYTLMAYGARTAPQVVLLADDNSLPISGRAAIRVVNGDNTAGSVTLLVDNGNVVIPSVAPGTASDYVDAVTAATTTNNVVSTLEIDSDAPTSFGPIFQSSNQRLLSQGVYTVFVLRGGLVTVNGAQVPAPTGQVRKDR